MARNSRFESREDGTARILRSARERYRRGQRIDLTELAAEYGIGRATAYRWLGDNERLLAHILAERISENFARLLRDSASNTGRERVLVVVDGFLRHAAGSDRLDALLRRDQRRVLKILTTSAYDVPQMIVDLFAELLSQEHSVGNMQLAAPAQVLASGIVRLIEACLYADVFVSETPDIDTTVQLIGLLMPASESDRGSVGPTTSP